MKLHATVCCPKRNVYTVDFDFLDLTNTVNRNWPSFSLPAQSYEHARAIEQAFNVPPKVTGK